MKYIFNTTTTMKPYNNKKWWIDGNIVTRKIIEADNVENALKQYKSIVEDKHCIEISNNAIKNKQPMYIDTQSGNAKQVGFVITGKTELEDDDNYKWVSQYIDLWIEILTVKYTEF